MADAGFRLSVEGEREFRKAISDINAILKLNQSELKRSVAEYNASEKDMDALTKRHKELEAAITTQIGAISEMSGEYSRLRNEYGENDKGVIKMKGSLDEAAASLATMQAQLKEVEAEMEKAEAASKSFSLEVEGEKKHRERLIEVFKEYTAVMDEAEKDIDAQIKALMAEAKATEDDTEKKRILNLAVDEHRKKLDILNAEMEEAVKLYGSQSKEVAEYRTQIANTQTEVQNLTRRIEDNNDTMEKAESGAKDLSDVFSQISDITGVQIPEGLTSMLGGIDTATVAAGGLVGILVEANKKILEMNIEAQRYATDKGSDILKQSAVTGLDTDTLQEWTYVSAQLNVNFDAIVDVLKDLRKNMYDAVQGNEDLLAEFADLGVQIADASGEMRDADDVLIELVDSFGDVQNETERMARMQKIMGESSRELNLLIYAGAEDLEYYRKRAQEKLVIDKELLDATERQRKAQEEFNAALDKTKTLLGTRGLLTGEAITGQGSWAAVWDNEIEYAKSIWNTITAFFGKIGFNAEGTYNWRGGATVVGERGPEIVDLPAGSRVYPNGEGPAMGTVNYYNITIPASDIRELIDIVRIAQSKRVTERMK